MSTVPTSAVRIVPLRGMDQRWRVDPTSAELIQDMTWDAKDSWRDSYGFRRIIHDYSIQLDESGRAIGTANALDTVDLVHSLHWFARHNGAIQYLVWESQAGDLQFFNGSGAPSVISEYIRDRNALQFNGTDRVRSYLATPNPGTQSITYAGRLYLVNGTDEPLVFDGRKAERAGFGSAPGEPFASVPNKTASASTSKPINHSSSKIGLGNRSERNSGYKYKVTYVNERGQESPASQPSNMIKFNSESGKSTPVLVNIPTGPVEVVARRVYRTLNLFDSSGDYIPQSSLHDATQGFENYYFVKEIQDNVTEFFYDITPDAAVGRVLDEVKLGPFPFNASHVAVFKNTMFVAEVYTNVLRFSEALAPEVFPVNNVFEIGDNALGPITGLYPTKNALVVFKSRGIYLVKGDPVKGFFAETLTIDAGCASADSIAEIPGLGVAFIGEAGIYMLNGALENTGTVTSVVNLSTPIPDVMERINLAALHNASAVINTRDHEYMLAVPERGETNPNLLLKFHYDVKEWSISENFPIACMVATADHRHRVFFGTWDITKQNNPTLGTRFNDSGIHVISHGWGTKGKEFDNRPNAIEPKYETSHLSFGSVVGPVFPIRAYAYAVGYGHNDMECNIVMNRETTDIYDSSQGHDQRYPTDKFPIYGTVTWDGTVGSDSATWVSPRPVVIRFDLSTSHRNLVHELQVKFNPESGTKKIQIIGIDVEVKAASPGSGAKALTLKHGGNFTR